MRMRMIVTFSENVMSFTNVAPSDLRLPHDLDVVLDRVYHHAIDPRDRNELACNPAGALAEFDVFVARAQRIIQ